MIINEIYNQSISAPVRTVKASVELFNGSALAETFTHSGKLKSFEIERVGENSKFFGFGICQHAQVVIRDVNREVDYITTAYNFTTVYEGGIKVNPSFYITQTRRKENTNELTLYGYDLLYPASTITLAEVALNVPYTIADVAQVCANTLGATGLVWERFNDTSYLTSYESGANFEGTETLREVLDDVAEATQSIYYIDSANRLVFKRLLDSAPADLAITKSDYFTLECNDGRRLSAITHATELGDNVTASASFSGTTQYVRDCGFWEMREDIDTLVENALAAVGGLSIRQFSCNWRGNPLLELGDKIELTTKDNNTVISYVLDDVISYDGSLNQRTQWSYTEQEETESNPSGLGEVLKQTYAKVDKANKQVEIVASEVGSFEGRISILELDTESINASVSNLEKTATERLDDANADMALLASRVDATITAEDVDIKINTALDNGVSKVETTTGFKFNDSGLIVSKTNSEMTTAITEDGMRVEKDGNTVLTANNEGVKAIDLHAETFLIIGTNSRFENYGSSRTGCFWIGGN